MTEDQDFDNFAHKFSHLFHEEPPEQKTIYTELNNQQQRYTAAEVIASGGMKQIKKVFDQSTSRNIALAEPLEKIDSSLYEVFLSEARLTALLEHPNIISIHDIGLNDNGKPYFTMDLKTGDSLEDILKNLHSGNQKYLQFYTQEELLLIFLKICDAVAYAHSKNILHLDLKPANIQVGDYGEVLVCDWGLGKIQSQNDTENFEELLLDAGILNGITSQGDIVGTPGFMAPEQVIKDGDTDALTDIYALGCLLYSLETYQRPLNGEVSEVLEKTKNGEIPPPQSRTSRPLPASLVAVINKSMRVSKEERYQSVNELKSDVQKYLSGYSTSAEQASLLKEFGLLVRRNKLTTTVTVLALTAIIAITLVFIDSLKDKIQETEAERQKATQLAEQFKNEKEKSQELHLKSQELHQKSDNLLQKLTKNYLSESGLMSSKFIYTYPMESAQTLREYANEVLTYDPDNKTARSRLIESLFIMQKFKELNNLNFTQGSKNELVKISKKYAPKLKNKINLLPINEIAKLIKSFKGVRRFSLAEKILVYDMKVRPGRSNYIEAVKAILTIRNQDWDQQAVDYDYEKKVLTINTPSIKYLRSKPAAGANLSTLRFLDINALILKQTSLSMLELHGSKVHSLDIRQAKLDHLNHIDKIIHLQELIISKGQFPPEKLKHIPQRIKIITK
jgi:serine/threonine protein kinase